MFQEGFVDPEELKEAKLNGNARYYENDNVDVVDDDDDIDDDNFLFVYLNYVTLDVDAIFLGEELLPLDKELSLMSSVRPWINQ